MSTSNSSSSPLSAPNVDEDAGGDANGTSNVCVASVRRSGRLAECGGGGGGGGDGDAGEWLSAMGHAED